MNPQRITIRARLNVVSLLPALVIASLSSSTTSAASPDLDCLELGKKVAAAQLSTDGESDQDQPDQPLNGQMISCKRLPDDAAKAIVIVHAPDSPLRLGIVTVATGHIVSRGEISGDIGADHEDTATSHLMIDTARYWVRPGSRAFAIVSVTHPYSNYMENTVKELNLYEQRGARIVPLLEDLAIDATSDGVSNCISGGDSSDDSPCTGNIDNQRVTLTMGKASSNGYTDIVVTTLSKHCSASSVDDCKAQATWLHEETKIYALEYDGKSYIEVDENEASKKVRTATLGDVKRCLLLENGYFGSNPPEDAVTRRLASVPYTAANMGADTIVPLSPLMLAGDQIFSVYRCGDQNESGKKVRVLTYNEASPCHILGNIAVNRPSDEGQDAVARKAQNVAAEMGANALVPVTSELMPGKKENDQVFGLYRCSGNTSVLK